MARRAGASLAHKDLVTEFHPAPHSRPRTLPQGRQAVYGFILDGRCLKVGKAGPESKARYTSQHYNPNSSGSNLSNSILRGVHRLTSIVSPHFVEDLASLNEQTFGGWLERHVARFNILIDMKYEEYEVSLLEAFFQCRLRPLFEGRSPDGHHLIAAAR